MSPSNRRQSKSNKEKAKKTVLGGSLKNKGQASLSETSDDPTPHTSENQEESKVVKKKRIQIEIQAEKEVKGGKHLPEGIGGDRSIKNLTNVWFSKEDAGTMRDEGNIKKAINELTLPVESHSILIQRGRDETGHDILTTQQLSGSRNIEAILTLIKRQLLSSSQDVRLDLNSLLPKQRLEILGFKEITSFDTRKEFRGSQFVAALNKSKENCYTRFATYDEKMPDGTSITRVMGSNQGYEGTQLKNLAYDRDQEIQKVVISHQEYLGVSQMHTTEMLQKFPEMKHHGMARRLAQEDARHLCYELLLEKISGRTPEYHLSVLLQSWNNWKVSFESLKATEKAALEKIIFYPDIDVCGVSRQLCTHSESEVTANIRINDLLNDEDSYHLFLKSIFNCGTVVLLDMMSRSPKGKLHVLLYFFREKKFHVNFQSTDPDFDQVDLTLYRNLIPHQFYRMERFKDILDAYERVIKGKRETWYPEIGLRWTWGHILGSKNPSSRTA